MRHLVLSLIVLAVTGIAAADADELQVGTPHEPLECAADPHVYVADIGDLPGGRLDLPNGYAVVHVRYRHQETSAGATYDELCVTLRPLGASESPAAPSTEFYGPKRIKVTVRERPPLPADAPRKDKKRTAK